MLNSCNFVGRIGSVEERNINQDRKAVRMSLAISESWKDRNGNWQEKTNWFNITRFMLSSYENRYKKGDLVAVTCKAQENKWTDAEGNKRSSIEFICKDIKLLHRKDNDESNSGSQQSNTSDVKTDATGVGTYIDEDGTEQDLPF
jgi:single-strand DNA-binding protein